MSKYVTIVLEENQALKLLTILEADKSIFKKEESMALKNYIKKKIKFSQQKRNGVSVKDRESR